LPSSQPGCKARLTSAADKRLHRTIMPPWSLLDCRPGSTGSKTSLHLAPCNSVASIRPAPPSKPVEKGLGLCAPRFEPARTHPSALTSSASTWRILPSSRQEAPLITS
jgi:hypothetical protein